MIVKTLKKDSDFVAFVNDIDLTKSLLVKDALKLDKLINKYGVLIFRNQNVSDEQQIKFTELFGIIELGPVYVELLPFPFVYFLYLLISFRG